MSKKIEKCDKCGVWINEKGECYCAIWVEDYRKIPLSLTFEKALLAYDHCKEQDNDSSPFSMDHWSGNCAVYFKGDYEKCMKVRRFVDELETKG